MKSARLWCFLLVAGLLLGGLMPAAPIQVAEAKPSSFGSAQAAVEIKEIEINQALGVQLNNAKKFVAGKSTVVRAILSADATVDAAQTSAVVKRDGQQVVKLDPKSSDKPANIVDFLCPNMQACGNWAAGSYSFEVTVNGVTKSTEGTEYKFVERREIRVLALPVKANYNGTIVSMPDDKWKTLHEFTIKVYPVAGDKFKWTLRDEFDASDAKYNLETDEGQLELWKGLTGLLPAHCEANPRGDGCYDLIVGFTPARHKGYPNGVGQGYTYGAPTNIVVATDNDAAATVAHEIAHVYKAGDTYTGGTLNCKINPAPDGMKGSDWDNRPNETTCSAGRVVLAGVDATKIPADQHPYEVEGRGPLDDMACYMGSGGKQEQFWTTQEVYDHLFEQLAP